MTLSIVIVNWNTKDYLLGALRSIQADPASSEYEILVVDNASTDGSAEAVRTEFPCVRLFAETRNLGYAAGNNTGLREATGEYILLLNPDVIVPAGALGRAVEALRRRPEAGALGVQQRFPDGRVQASLRGFPYPLAILYAAIGLSRLFPSSRRFGAYRMTWFAYDREIECDQPMGTFLLMTRQALDTIGLLDEQFPIFFNEVDWCYRARQAGLRIYFTPEVWITHYGGGSTSQVGARMAWESRGGLLRFYRKHFRRPWDAPVYWLAAGASWLQAWFVSRRRKR